MRRDLPLPLTARNELRPRNNVIARPIKRARNHEIGSALYSSRACFFLFFFFPPRRPAAATATIISKRKEAPLSRDEPVIF